MGCEVVWKSGDCVFEFSHGSNKWAVKSHVTSYVGSGRQ